MAFWDFFIIICLLGWKLKYQFAGNLAMPGTAGFAHYSSLPIMYFSIITQAIDSSNTLEYFLIFLRSEYALPSLDLFFNPAKHSVGWDERVAHYWIQQNNSFNTLWGTFGQPGTCHPYHDGNLILSPHPSHTSLMVLIPSKLVLLSLWYMAEAIWFEPFW